MFREFLWLRGVTHFLHMLVSGLKGQTLVLEASSLTPAAAARSWCCWLEWERGGPHKKVSRRRGRGGPDLRGAQPIRSLLHWPECRLPVIQTESVPEPADEL